MSETFFFVKNQKNIFYQQIIFFLRKDNPGLTGRNQETQQNKWYSGPQFRKEYTVKMLLVVDPPMEERYGHDLKDFLYLLMSLTSNLFAKANLGYRLKIAVSNIRVLPQDINATKNFSGSKVIGKYVVQSNKFTYDSIEEKTFFNFQFRQRRRRNVENFLWTHEKFKF